MEKPIEKWRLKAIGYLESSDDKDIRKAIKVLKDGKGYLTTILPVQIIFYEDIK